MIEIIISKPFYAFCIYLCWIFCVFIMVATFNENSDAFGFGLTDDAEFFGNTHQ